MNKFISRKIYQQVHCVSLPICEDSMFSLDVYKYVEKVCFLPVTAYRYRQLESGASKRYKYSRTLTERLTYPDAILAFWKDNKLPMVLAYQFYARNLLAAARDIFFLDKKEKCEIRVQRFKDISRHIEWKILFACTSKPKFFFGILLLKLHCYKTFSFLAKKVRVPS